VLAKPVKQYAAKRIHGGTPELSKKYLDESSVMDYANEYPEKKDEVSSIFPKGFDQSGEEDSLLNVL
jgi:hypothetical protein